MIAKYFPLYGDNIIKKIKEKIIDIIFAKHIKEILNNDLIYFYQYKSWII